MLRLISSRPLHLLLRRASPLHQLRSLATEILPIPHEIEEVSPAHHELLEVLSHRSSQLSSSKVPEKVEERKAKKIDDPSFPPPNRLAELSAQLHLNFDPEHELLEEAEEEPSSTLIPDEPVLAPSLEDLTWTEDDKTLNDLLSSLHSTKVRRIHKYTDEQLSLMHKHHEFNRMLQSYVDVSIHNGQLGKVRRLLDELLVDQERRQSMKHLTWRYVSNVNIYNSFFFAYAERVSDEEGEKCSIIGRLRRSGKSSSTAKTVRKDATSSNQTQSRLVCRCAELFRAYGSLRSESCTTNHS